jgi:hypothetical protein
MRIPTVVGTGNLSKPGYPGMDRIALAIVPPCPE